MHAAPLIRRRLREQIKTKRIPNIARFHVRGASQIFILFASTESSSPAASSPSLPVQLAPIIYLLYLDYFFPSSVSAQRCAVCLTGWPF